MLTAVGPSMRYFDETVNLDEFVGTDLWVKVIDTAKVPQYIHILSNDSNQVVYSAVPVSVVEDYDLTWLDDEEYLATESVEEFICSCCTYIRGNGHTRAFSYSNTGDFILDNYIVYVPYQILTTEEIFDALTICKSFCMPSHDTTDDWDIEDEDEE